MACPERRDAMDISFVESVMKLLTAIIGLIVVAKSLFNRQKPPKG
jgi:hypothetical protein